MVDFGKLLARSRAERAAQRGMIDGDPTGARPKETRMTTNDGSGLGLDDFLGYDPDKEKRQFGQFLEWDKEIRIWLALAGRIYATWTHQFIVEDEVDEKDQGGNATGKSKLILRWPRFVSPDAVKVHANQYFREDKGKGVMQEYPDRDRFLILREWLRARAQRDELGLDDVVFEWVDHKSKKGDLIQWTVGELTGLVKRGKDNRGHSLDSKLEYIFLVVKDDKPEDGVLIARETKLLGDKMRAAISKNIKSKGNDAGNPYKTPVAFDWIFDEDAKTPMNYYDAYPIEAAECSDAIWEAINVGEVPDVSQFVVPGEDDTTKIRAAFEAAAQFDLPIEMLFDGVDSDDHDRVVDALLRGDGGQSAAPPRRPAPPSQPGRAAAPAQGGARRPAPQTPAAPPTTGRGGATRPGQTRAAPPPAAAPAAAPAAPSRAPTGGGRRRVVEPPPEPPPEEQQQDEAAPEEEHLPCDKCGADMLATDTECASCGAQYEVDADPDAPPPAPPPQTGRNGATRPTGAQSKPSAPARPAASSQPQRPPQRQAPAARAPSSTTGRGGARRPGAAPPQEQGGEGDDDGGDGPTGGGAPPQPGHCWACGHDHLEQVDGGGTRCGNCGVDQSDDLPF